MMKRFFDKRLKLTVEPPFHWGAEEAGAAIAAHGFHVPRLKSPHSLGGYLRGPAGETAGVADGIWAIQLQAAQDARGSQKLSRETVCVPLHGVV